MLHDRKHFAYFPFHSRTLHLPNRHLSNDLLSPFYIRALCSAGSQLAKIDRVKMHDGACLCRPPPAYFWRRAIPTALLHRAFRAFQHNNKRNFAYDYSWCYLYSVIFIMATASTIARRSVHDGSYDERKTSGIAKEAERSKKMRKTRLEIET